MIIFALKCSCTSVHERRLNSCLVCKGIVRNLHGATRVVLMVVRIIDLGALPEKNFQVLSVYKIQSSLMF